MFEPAQEDFEPAACELGRIAVPGHRQHARSIGLAIGRQMFQDVVSLVNHPALHHRQIAEYVAERLADPASAVHHAQHAAVDLEPALEQSVEQRGAEHGVLGRAEPQSQHHVAGVGQNARCDDYRAARDLDAVDHQYQEIESVEPTLKLLAQLVAHARDEVAARGAFARAARDDLGRGRLQALRVTARGYAE